jgi:hypothetical protein
MKATSAHFSQLVAVLDGDCFITTFPVFSATRFPAGFSVLTRIVIGTASPLSHQGLASAEHNQVSHPRIDLQNMNVPPQFRAKAPSRGYKIARAIILPMALFVITFTFTSKFSVDPAKVDVRACHFFLSLATPSDLE